MTGIVVDVVVIVAFFVGGAIGGAAIYFGGVRRVAADLAKAVKDGATTRSDLDQARRELVAATAKHTDALAAARAAQATAEANLEAVRAARAEADSTYAAFAQRFLREAQETLLNTATERFRAVAGSASAESAARVDKIAAGVGEQVKALQTAIANAERARADEREALAANISGLRSYTETLGDAVAKQREATDKFVAVFANSQARGTWGEMELTRIIEYAGMLRYVDFDTQKAGFGDDGRGRPDAVIYIAGGGKLPIDAKTPYAAYQTAVLSEDDEQRQTYMRDAAAALRTHVRALAARRYHLTPGAVGFTIAFVPIESMLNAILAIEPSIFEEALRQNVLLATPLTLVIQMHAFAAGWSYATQQENAQTILEQAKILVNRLSTFVTHFVKVGDRIASSVDVYNSAVGSFEQSLAPQARRIHELGGAEELPELPHRPLETRRLDHTRLPATTVSLFDPDPSAP